MPLPARPRSRVCRRLAVRVAPLAVAILLLAAPPPGAAIHRSVDGPAEVQVVQTTANLSERLTPLPDLEFGAAPLGGLPVIYVDDQVRYQQIRGFGAAMTDSSAWLIGQELPASARATLLGSLFGSGGIHLRFVRVPIGASDFTRNGRPYSYDDLPPGRSDPKLSRFSIAHDNGYILPVLRQVRSLNRGVEMLASPWSPPAWMKSNRSLSNANHTGTLIATDVGPWARYLVKFLQDYARAGVPVAAITPQNEPTQATTYPGVELPEASEANWTRKDLEPALAAAHLHPDVYGNDLGWGPLGTAYAKALATNRAVKLKGIAWHCYYGSPGVMNTVHSIAPALDEIVDECSPGITPFPTSEIVIASLRNWASTVALWNLALDPKGGPVQLPNSGCGSCTGLATIDEHTHTAKLELDYYQLGQASAFIEPGAQRVESDNFVGYDYKSPGVNPVTPGLDDVAFVNPDGSRVLVAYDNSAQPIQLGVEWNRLSLAYTLPARAMVTLVWDR
jgi:glucosylceramidase